MGGERERGRKREKEREREGRGDKPVANCLSRLPSAIVTKTGNAHILSHANALVFDQSRH